MTDIHYNLEQYTGGRKPAGTPKVTIRKEGRISFNAPAFELLKCPKYITLHYDKEHRIIGFKAYDPKSEKAECYFKVTGRVNKDHVVSAGDFLRNYDVEHPVSKAFESCTYNDYLIIDLNGPSEEATSTRKMRSRELRSLDAVSESSRGVKS